MNVTEETRKWFVKKMKPEMSGYASVILTELATRLREQWEAERLQPTPGPPDLEGVPDHAEYFVWIGCQQPDGSWHTGRRNLKTAAYLRALDDWLRVDWHIQIPDITLPEPELPKCPWCGNTLHKMGRASFSKKWITLGCDSCAYETETFKTEAEAIAAARKAGE